MECELDLAAFVPRHQCVWETLDYYFCLLPHYGPWKAAPPVQCYYCMMGYSASTVCFDCPQQCRRTFWKSFGEVTRLAQNNFNRGGRKSQQTSGN